MASKGVGGRSVTSVLLDAAYDTHDRTALRMLTDKVGHVVEQIHLPKLIGECFPEVEAHPDFVAQAESCVDVVASILNLEAWEGDWLITRRGEGMLSDIRRRIGPTNHKNVAKLLREAGPSIRDPDALVEALVRAMPDLRVDAAHRQLVSRINPTGRGHKAAAGGPKAAAADAPTDTPPRIQRRQKAAEKGDPRWRPTWWHKLRDWSSQNGFKLEPMDATRLEETEAYCSRVFALLESDEPLAAMHWGDGFKKTAGLKMTEVQRIEVHGHVMHEMVNRFEHAEQDDPSESPSGYRELIRQGFLLGMADDVVDMAIRSRVVSGTTVKLRKGMRVASTVGPHVPLNEVLAAHDAVNQHARSLGMTAGGVAKATQLLGVTHWDLASRAVAKALRYRIPMVLIDDLLDAGMRDEIEARVVRFPAARAAACGRCGIIHTFNARRVHRTDAICSDCR